MSFHPSNRPQPGVLNSGDGEACSSSALDSFYFSTFDNDYAASNHTYSLGDVFLKSGVAQESRVIKSDLDVVVFDEVVDLAMESQQSFQDQVLQSGSQTILSLAPPEEWSDDYLEDLSTNVTSTPRSHQKCDLPEEQNLIYAEEKLLSGYLPDFGYGSFSISQIVEPSNKPMLAETEAICNKRQTSNEKRSPKKKRAKGGTAPPEETICSPAFSKEDLQGILKLRQEDGTWVECCEPECGKWRYLKDILDPSKVPQFWTCSMLKMSCSEVQAECEKPEELVYVRFTSGSVIWAKSEGHPWWPGMIDEDPETGTFFWPQVESGHSYPEWYYVTFIHGDESVTSGWVLDKDLRNFDGENPNLKKKSKFKKSKKLKSAILTAQRISSLDVNLRREKYSFISKLEGDQTPEKAGDGPN